MCGTFTSVKWQGAESPVSAQTTSSVKTAHAASPDVTKHSLTFKYLGHTNFTRTNQSLPAGSYIRHHWKLPWLAGYLWWRLIKTRRKRLPELYSKRVNKGTNSVKLYNPYEVSKISLQTPPYKYPSIASSSSNSKYFAYITSQSPVLK
jgi:hypothetical protein